jgi:hypothetical protein
MMRGLGGLAPLLVLVAILAVFASMYALQDEHLPEGVELLSGICLSLFVVYWIMLDARQRRRVPCHDFGFLVCVFLPVSLAWYVIWTRGLRGLLLLGFLMLVFAIPSLSAVFAWWLRFG